MPRRQTLCGRLRLYDGFAGGCGLARKAHARSYDLSKRGPSTAEPQSKTTPPHGFLGYPPPAPEVVMAWTPACGAPLLGPASMAGTAKALT